MVGALTNNLTQALDDYQNLINDNFEEKFEVYANYTRTLTTEALLRLMGNEGRQYFTCTAPKYGICCKDCKDPYCLENGYC